MISKIKENLNLNKNDQNKRRALVAVVVATVAFVSFISSNMASAGIGSLFQSMIGKNEANAKFSQAERLSSTQTSQTVVLQASNASVSISLADIPPLEGNAILSADVARMNSTSSDPLNTQISIYTVRPGDTISGVAKMFNVSINTVLWANDLTSRSILKPGMTLIILPVTGTIYTVKSNDTIQGIAKKHGADVEDILNYNDLTIDAKLKIGQEILIPNAEISTKAIATQTGRTSTAVVYDNDENWPSYSGYYSCPVRGARVSQKLHGHNGVDLAAPVGTPVLASAGGTVIINKSNGAWNGGYGNFVVILHSNGSQSLYSHLSRSIIEAGDIVSSGTVIGYVGVTGLTTGPHLHFEIRGAKNPFSNQSLCR